jgi:hypothetical protein
VKPLTLRYAHQAERLAQGCPPKPPCLNRPRGAEMARHDEYGKHVIREATKGLAALYGPPVEINYGAGRPARIDATFGDIAIEVESRVSKQVRGAVLDLICHAHPKKLLVLLPVHMPNPEMTAEQCRNIMKRVCQKNSFRVVVLKGSGDSDRLAEDSTILAAALVDLGSTFIHKPSAPPAMASAARPVPTTAARVRDTRVEPPMLSRIAAPRASGRRGEIADFLKEHRAQAYCDDCLANTLHLAQRQQAQQITSSLQSSVSARV